MTAPQDKKTQDLLRQMDEAGIGTLHKKVLLTAGMGFFTDAYDLFIIGVVMTLLRDEWHPSTLEISLVTSSALIASAVGAVLFGRLADLFGRHRIYGLEALVLSAGAVASACAPSMIWLIGFRVILGLGIGGDYPVSSTIMSEYAGKRTRGFLLSLVFAMQGIGLIVGPLIATGLLASGISHSLAWRIMLALGAIPALSVFYLRRQIGETPRFLLAARQGAASDASPGNEEPTSRKAAPHELRQLFQGRALARFLGVCAAWFALNFPYYGNTVSSPVILSLLDPDKNLQRDILLMLAIFALAALPGYLLVAFTMDRLGRKTIQGFGFLLMAAAFAALGLIPDVAQFFWPFLIIYGLSFFFTEFGPNTTTFIYPAEIFPVHLRTTAHGLASAAGKLGGFGGVFVFPFLLNHGLEYAELLAAGVCLLGALLTGLLLPETNGRSLEELSETAVPEPSLS